MPDSAVLDMFYNDPIVSNQIILERLELLYSDNFNYLFNYELGNIQKFLSKEQSVLDIGSAFGLFLYRLSLLGYKNIHGCEISEKQRLLSKELFGYSLLGDLYDIASVKYDCITMLDVIEHVKDPIPFIQYAADLLNKNGYLLISTINFNSIHFKVAKTFWYGFTPPRHLYYFTYRGIKKCMENRGFQIVNKSTAILSRGGIRTRFRSFLKNIHTKQVDTSTDYWNREKLEKRINSLKIRPKQDTACLVRESVSKRLIRTLVARLNIGDTIQIVCRKI